MGNCPAKLFFVSIAQKLLKKSPMAGSNLFILSKEPNIAADISCICLFVSGIKLITISQLDLRVMSNAFLYKS